MEENLNTSYLAERKFSLHGWIGIGLAVTFWIINWVLPGQRTHWAFFPMWLGYCLTIDALVLYRTGTSLLARSRWKYASLFIISSPAWWLFEAINSRLNNWNYIGSADFSQLTYALMTSLSFSTVIPAVFGTSELASSFPFIRNARRWIKIIPNRPTTIGFFITGLVMFALMMAWPQIFFPFVWISLYFMLEPINVWLGNRSLASYLKQGDWRPILALFVGVLITAFFWEMWNYFSYPKWVYHIPWGGGLKIFEMPLLGYGGYLPFALELFALYHLVVGLLGEKDTDYVHLE